MSEPTEEKKSQFFALWVKLLALL